MADISKAFTLLENYFPDTNASNDGYSVTLPEIYENLTLSDYVFSSQNAEKKVIIVNLSEKMLESKNNKYIYNFRIDDSENVPYYYFKNVMLQCAHFIDHAQKNNRAIIVNCTAGINRSCSAIVAYSLLSKKFSVNTTMNYIKSSKSGKYGDVWPTLTNPKFVEYLKRMQSELLY